MKIAWVRMGMKGSKNLSRSAKPLSSTQPAKSKNSSKEVEDIIGKLNRMSIDDPAYAIQYFRAYQLNPIIAEIVPKPNSWSKDNTPSQQPPTNNPPPRNTSRTFPPRTNAPDIGVHRQSLPMGERYCYGCGSRGHTLGFCPAIADLVEKGIVKRNGLGKLVMADGTQVFRMNSETLEAAVKRLRSVHANFVTATSTYQEPIPETYECEYFSEDDSFDEETFTVTRAQGKAKERRKDFSGVYPPARKMHEDKHPRFQPRDTSHKENMPLPPSRATRNTAPIRKPVPIEPEQPVVPPKPETVDKPRFNPNDSDAFMEDETISAPKTSVPFTDLQNVKDDARVIIKRIPRKSEVQSQVDQMNVLGRILSQPVTLAVGEVFGISKELTHHLQDVLKPKISAAPISKAISTTPKVNNVNQDPYVATTFVSKSRGTLIHL